MPSGELIARIALPQPNHKLLSLSHLSLSRKLNLYSKTRITLVILTLINLAPMFKFTDNQNPNLNLNLKLNMNLNQNLNLNLNLIFSPKIAQYGYSNFDKIHNLRLQMVIKTKIEILIKF